MIQKIKENQYIQRIKELLQNKRTRAITQLVLWMLFFVFVFYTFDLRGKKTQNPKEKTVIETWMEQKNYQYQMTFSINQEDILVKGIRNQLQEVFSLQSRTYYFNDNKLYLFENDIEIPQEYTTILGYEFLKLRPEFLGQLLSYGKLEYTTNYETGMVRKAYSIPIAKFVYLYDGTQITDEDDIKIELLENEKVITEVNLDLTSFFRYSENIIEQYKVTITYFDIGTDANIKLE